MANGDWIALGSLAFAGLAILLGYLKRPAFVPVGRLDGLLEENRELQGEVDRLEKRVSQMEVQIASLRTDVEWWRNQWRIERDRRGEQTQRIDDD